MGEELSDPSILELNASLESFDRQTSRDVLQIYLDLYENDPLAFSKEATKAYNFAPLSSLMADQIKHLTNK